MMRRKFNSKGEAEAIFVAMAIRASASFAHAAIAMGALEEEAKPTGKVQAFRC